MAKRCGMSGGSELFYAMKYPCRFLFIFPREAYFFVFRRRQDGAPQSYKYSIVQTPYRAFSKTLDPAQYETALNGAGQTRTLKITFRDEERTMGIFRRPTVVSIWESAG